MALLGWFKKKREEKINISDRKQSALQDAAVAATFAEAGEHETALRMLDKSKGKNTILVIGWEDSFSELVIEYALDMAKRLEFELLALNITDKPLALPADKRDEAIAAFELSCAANCIHLQEKAAEAGIRLSLLVEIGNQDAVVEKLHHQYPGMRYVLTEPDPDAVKKAKTSVSVPVFDLGSYQGAAA